MKEDSKQYTAFQSPLGLLEFNYLPFGLSTAASTFQRMMRHILRGIPNVVSYFDDILAFGSNFEEHLASLKNVLVALRNYGLTARPVKTCVGFREIEFLGHTIAEGIQKPEQTKLEKIKNLKPPKTKKEVRKVLGLLNYYRKYVNDFASIAETLTDLTKKGQPNQVIWDENCQASFDRLKQALCQEPILIIPDMNKEFVVRTDASDHGIGGVLMQSVEGQLMPCAYSSRKLLDRERRYPIIEKECLAVVYTVGVFEKYLLLKHFVIETDHKPLTVMKKNKMKNSRLMRWSLALQRFNFSVRPIKGHENIEADILSRFL